MRNVALILNALLLAGVASVSYTHLRAHETVLDLVFRLLLEKKKKTLLNCACGNCLHIVDNNSSTRVDE